mmetsp:Transcript_20042/g.59753  ORF Transcript_20042/g.59753 Transcript_20042/m.59753 type:complete len:228 (+) Transcript_20042:235-918(+)
MDDGDSAEEGDSRGDDAEEGDSAAAMASRRVATSSTLRRGAGGVASGGRGGASTSRGGSSTSRGGGESGGGGGGSTVSSSSGNVDSIVAGESGDSARSARANTASDATTRRNCCHDNFCALSAPSRRSRAREKASPSTPSNRGADASRARRAAWTVMVASISDRLSNTLFKAASGLRAGGGVGGGRRLDDRAAPRTFSTSRTSGCCRSHAAAPLEFARSATSTGNLP